MKAASIVMKEPFVEEHPTEKTLLNITDRWLEDCRAQSVELAVFPGLWGVFWRDSDSYLSSMLELSQTYPEIAFCPGSFWETSEEDKYHSSCLLKNGEIILQQRQLYLAKWEQRLGLTRGTEVNTCILHGFHIGILLPTDSFYPQVSRYLSLTGTDLVLAPAAIKGEASFPLQLSGVWQNVQQNLFFAIESGFKGELDGTPFYAESIIHAPLAMTDKEDGFLAREGKEALLVSNLDNKKRKQAVSTFDPLQQLNPDFYKAHLFQ